MKILNKIIKKIFYFKTNNISFEKDETEDKDENNNIQNKNINETSNNKIIFNKVDNQLNIFDFLDKIILLMNNNSYIYS